MKGEKVYALIASGMLDGEALDNVTSLFADIADAKETMAQDIKSLKEDWSSFIDYDNPDSWIEIEDAMRYEGYTPYDDYQYSLEIQELEIH